MKRGIVSLTFALALIGPTPIDSRAQTNTLVVPKEAVEGFGDSFANLFPTANPVQQVYSAGEFADAVADTIWITGIALRFNDPEAAMDATVPKVTLTMGVFEGSMDELTADMDQSLRNGKVVLDRRNFRLTADRPRGPRDFNVKLPVDIPFLYNRNHGHLVVRFEMREPSTGGQSCDAHRVSPDRGLYLIRFSDGMPAGAYELVATEFSYIVLPVIEAIRLVENHIAIDFSHVGTGEGVRVESAPVVNGQYTIVQDAEFTRLPEGKIRAVIPISTKDRFFRIMVE
jgi:hypothetical protein